MDLNEKKVALLTEMPKATYLKVGLSNISRVKPTDMIICSICHETTTLPLVWVNAAKPLDPRNRDLPWVAN
jgi:hypothetical protein